MNARHTHHHPAPTNGGQTPRTEPTMEHLSRPTTQPPRSLAADTRAENQPSGTWQILIADQQTALPVDTRRIKQALRSILNDTPYTAGMISVAVVDDPTIHQLNRQYLEHDYPTDVLSFVLEDAAPSLQGELVVSSDTAIAQAASYGWGAEQELLLYIIHGALHLVGYRDHQQDEREAMLAAELAQLGQLGIPLPADCSRWLPTGEASALTSQARSRKPRP